MTQNINTSLQTPPSGAGGLLELATIDIKKGTNQGFETAIEQAKLVICQSKGFIYINVKHCIEQTNRYILLIQWETLEDHTIGFRESELFKEWRALIGPFFENPPLVQHYN
jgi:heme-degrading monooxygenase HmoA